MPPKEKPSRTRKIESEYRPSLQQRERFDLLKNLSHALETATVHYSVLGGYGLDALYGKLSRDHDDIDIIVEEEDHVRAQEIISNLDFAHLKTEEGVEKYVHKTTGTKLDLGNSKLFEQAIRHLEPGAEIDSSLYFPEQTNAVLEGVSLRTATLEAQQQVAAIQLKRFGRKAPKAVADEKLIRKIIEKSGK